MTANDIVAEWAAQGKVEEILTNILGRKPADYEEDLVQDIYLNLLNTPEERVISLYESGQANYYITRVLLNNVNSVTSRYYYLYRRFRLLGKELDTSGNKRDD